MAIGTRAFSSPNMNVANGVAAASYRRLSSGEDELPMGRFDP